MLEYVFFHALPYDQFLDYLKAEGLSPETSQEDGVFEARLPDTIDDALSDRIEARYDTLMELNQELFYAENAESADNFVLAGIDLKLKDDARATALVAPDVIARVLEAITGDEFDEMVAAIVQAVEDPDGKTFCDTVREKRAQNPLTEGQNPLPEGES